MTKVKYITIYLMLLSVFSWSQTNENSLINIHSINSLSDTASINNPQSGVLVYANSNQTTYQFNGNGWVEWYKFSTNNLASLINLTNNLGSNTCCNTTLDYVDCGSSSNCVGDTLRCGVIVSITNGVALVAAIDEYNFIPWFGGACPISYIGGSSTLDIVNNCPTDHNAATISYEYKPEGCQGNGQQWILPDTTQLNALETSMNIVNPIFELLGGKRVYTGNVYWALEELWAQQSFTKEIGGGTTEINKTQLRRIRPFTLVTVP